MWNSEREVFFGGGIVSLKISIVSLKKKKNQFVGVVFRQEGRI